MHVHGRRGAGASGSVLPEVVAAGRRRIRARDSKDECREVPETRDPGALPGLLCTGRRLFRGGAIAAANLMPNDQTARSMLRFPLRGRSAAIMVPLIVAGAAAGQAPRSPTMAGRSPVYAPHGVAATSQPLATEAALGVLEHGGNAIDAAVTAAAVLSVVEPMMTGIGGGPFSVGWAGKEERLGGVNASGRAGALIERGRRLRPGRRQTPCAGA